MGRVTWLDTGFVDPHAARLSVDDPGARFGDGLRETLRVQDGTLPWIDRHLARLRRSAEALRLADGLPPIEAITAALDAVADRCANAIWRASMIVSAHPTLLVDAVLVDPDPATPLHAVTCPGLWVPDNRLAEHKTIAYLPSRLALRVAAAEGADTALLLDRNRNLGEAATANVFCVVDGMILTPPVRGLLPGVTRAAVMDLMPVAEIDLPETIWGHCDEMFVTSAVQRVVGVASVDGVPIGDGAPGPITRAVQDAMRSAFG